MGKRVIGVLAGVGALVGSGRAATIRVPEDYATVWQAVDAAVSGDSVMVAAGTWTDTDTRVVSIGGSPRTFTCAAYLKGGMSVIGAGPGVTIVDAQQTGSGGVVPLLFANDPGEAVLEGMTITGAAQGGPGIAGVSAGRLIVRECRVNANDAATCVGGIVVDTCDLLLEDSEVSFNFGVQATAGVDANFCEVQAYRTRFEGNQGRALQVKNNNTDDIVVEDCEFIDNRMSVSGAACTISDPANTQVRGNVFLRNVNTGGVGGGLWIAKSFGSITDNVFAFDSTYGGNTGAGGLFASQFFGPILRNTFVGCHVDAPSPGAALITGDGSSLFEFANNLFVGCTGGGAIGVFIGQSLPGTCNGFWNNEAGIGGYAPDATDLFLDPHFCAPASLDFSLAENSPYAAANNAPCGQVGALGEGCGPTSIESASWGRIKTLYRR